VTRDVDWLIAPDSFKGTFSAREVALAIAAGASGEDDDARLDICPVADGGEGTLDTLVRELGGRTVEQRVSDPLGRPVSACVGWVGQDAMALVEVAGASGYDLVPASERDAEAASTFGTGELIAAAVREGASHVAVAAGGSASTDGGAGAIQAIESAGGLRGAKLTVLADVSTPFELAAVVFGPQKGADAGAVERLTGRLHEQAGALPRDPRGMPMSGAAGGLAGGLWARYGASIVPGAAPQSQVRDVSMPKRSKARPSARSRDAVRVSRCRCTRSSARLRSTRSSWRALASRPCARPPTWVSCAAPGGSLRQRPVRHELE
jgi:glycerate kinase